MTRFPTAGHLASWAGLAPAARQSGPRNRKPSKGQGDAYLKGYCTQAADRRREHRHLPRRAAPPPVPANSAAPGPGAPSEAPSSSSSGTCSPTPRPGSPTSAPTGTHRKTDRDRKTRTHLRGLKALGHDVTSPPAA